MRGIKALPEPAPAQRGGHNRFGIHAGRRGRGGVPLLTQFAQGVDGLGRAGGQGRALAQIQQLASRRFPPGVLVPELGEQDGHRGLDLHRPPGERRQQPVGDAVDLERGAAPLTAGAQGPGDRQPGGKGVGKQVVIDLGERVGGVVQGAGVHRAPSTVRALDLVRDDDVGVQVRVSGGCPSDQTLRRSARGCSLGRRSACRRGCAGTRSWSRARVAVRASVWASATACRTVGSPMAQSTLADFGTYAEQRVMPWCSADVLVSMGGGGGGSE